MDSQAPKEMQEAIQPNRLPCDAEVFRKSEEFCRNLLETVPEIGAVAIVPVWHTPPENFPPVLLRFRNPAETPMAAVLQLLKTVAGFSQNLNRELVGQYQMFENYVKELAEKIKQHEDTLKEQESGN